MKKILGAIFFLVLMILTFYIVLRDQDLGQIVNTIQNMDKVYLGIAVLTAFFFVAAEGILFWYLFRALGNKAGFFQCIKYAFIGFFYCGVTPSASGGQPMQLYHMNKDGHRIADSTVALISAAAAYKFILVLMGIGIAIFWWGGLSFHLGKYMVLFFVGLFLNAALVTVLLLILCNGAGMRKILLACERFAVKIHLLRPSKERVDKIYTMIEQYQETVTFLKTHVGVIVFMLGITFVQRCAVFGLTYFIYRGMGLEGAGFWAIMALQAVVYITVDMLPLPGSQGVTELVYIAAFSQIFINNTLTASLCVTRCINFYIPLIVGAIVAGISFMHEKKVASN